MDRAGEKNAVGSGPATITVSALEDDDFGDFESASTPSNAPTPQLLLDLSDYDLSAIFKSTPTFPGKYTLLAPLVPTPTSSAHTVLASIAPLVPSLRAQGQTLHLLARYLSPFIKAVSTWDVHLVLLETTLDRFEAGLLTVFEKEDTDRNEARMTEVAAASRHVCLLLHLHDSGSRDSGAARGEWDSWWK